MQVEASLFQGCFITAGQSGARRVLFRPYFDAGN